MTFGENGVLLGGVGCPLVGEFDVYDLAAQLGMSSESGCGYVAKILELRYRLPRTWQRVVSLAVPVWKAFIVCGHTMNLTFEAATHIDTMLAPVLHSCSFEVFLGAGGATTTGTIHLTGTLALEDALDLNTQITSSAYTPTDKLVEQVRLRDQCCVFPNCTRRARHCDLDHVIPFDHDRPGAGGPTSTSTLNLALLCRRHHRTKTFST